MWPFLWPLRQILPQIGQILFPFRGFAARAPLFVYVLNRRVERELRRFQVAAARGDVRVVEEQLHRVEIGAALEQTASGLVPQVVQVEIELRELQPVSNAATIRSRQSQSSFVSARSRSSSPGSSRRSRSNSRSFRTR